MSQACPMLRPGGLELTRQGLELANLTPGQRLLDAGCGAGATVQALTEAGYDMLGLDDAAVIADAKERHPALAERFFPGDAQNPWPLQAHSLDGALFECTLSVMDAPKSALAAAKQALKGGGRILVTDMYARGQSTALCGMVQRLDEEAQWKALFSQAGYTLLHWQDCSHLLTAMLGQMIFDMGVKAAYAALGGDEVQIKQAKCGYFLAVLAAQ